MTENFKNRLWGGLGVGLVAFNIPLGLYTAYQGAKLLRSDKIGDYATVEKCKRRIKVCWIIVIVFYIVMIMLAATGAFAD